VGQKHWEHGEEEKKTTPLWGTQGQHVGGVAGVESGSSGQSLSQAVALAGLVECRAGGTAGLDKDLALLLNVPVQAARRRASLIQLEGAVAGRSGAKGLAGCVPGNRRGRPEGDQQCLLRKQNLGMEEWMGNGVDLYCLPPCSFLLQLCLPHCKTIFPHLSLSFPSFILCQ